LLAAARSEQSRQGLIAAASYLTREADIDVRRDIAYGSLPRQHLDLYSPRSRRSRAVIVFFYGGGWESGDRAMYGFVGYALASRGLTVAVADYRLYPEIRFPTFMQDAAAAYVFVARTIAQDATGAEPIYVMGHSAGAYIAALLAYDPAYIRMAEPDAPAPAGVIGMSGPYAFNPTTWPSTRDIFAAARQTPDQARPIAFVNASSPPTLLLQGLADGTVQPYNSRDLCTALRASGVWARLIEYPRLGHIPMVLSLARNMRWLAPTLDAITDFAISPSRPDQSGSKPCGGPA